MSKYERLTKSNIPCSVACREFGGKHEQYYYRLAELEDKIENGQFGDIVDYKHRIEVLERALKKVINEYTYDREITVPGCEDCDIVFGRPQGCLQTQFNRLVEQAEQELQEQNNG